MSLVTKFYILTNKLYERIKDVDLSADDKAELIQLKNEAVSAIRKFENKFKEASKMKDEYVIRLYENDHFIGYVDHIEENGNIISVLVTNDDEVENDVYSTKEEVEEQIRILQEDSDMFSGIDPDDDSVLTYIAEERN